MITQLLTLTRSQMYNAISRHSHYFILAALQILETLKIT